MSQKVTAMYMYVDLHFVTKSTWWERKGRSRENLQEAAGKMISDFLESAEDDFYDEHGRKSTPLWWQRRCCVYVTGVDKDGGSKLLVMKHLYKTAEEFQMTEKQKAKYEEIYKEMTKDDIDFTRETFWQLEKQDSLHGIDDLTWRAIISHRKKVERAIIQRWEQEKEN